MDRDAEIAELRRRIEQLERLAGVTPPPRPETPHAPAPPPPAPIVHPAPPPPVAPISPPPPPLPPSTVSPAERPASSIAVSGEAWLARIGIGLLLIGLLFFLKLSLDRGWITPLLQILLGAGGCGVLLVWGNHIAPRRPQMGDLAFGGGIAGLIGVFCAGQYLYDLYGGGVTFAGVTVAALVCLGQALRRNSEALCLLALLGGFPAPFFLGVREPSFFALHALVSAGLAWTVFYLRGWRGVLAVAGLGTAVLLLAGSLAAGKDVSSPLPVQAALILCWVGFWLVPVAASLRRSHRSALWLTAFLPALVGLLCSHLLWDQFSRTQLGVILLGLAATSSILGGLLRAQKLPAAAPQFVAAALFAGSAIPALLDGATCWGVFAAFTLALHLAAKAEQEKGLFITAHLASAVSWIAFAVLAGQLAGVTGWQPQLTFSLLALLAAGGAVARLSQQDGLRVMHSLLTHVGLIAFIAAETAADLWPEAVAPLLCGLVALAAAYGWLTGPGEELRLFAHLTLVTATIFAIGGLLGALEATPWLNWPAASLLGLGILWLVQGLAAPGGIIRNISCWVAHLLWLFLLWSQLRSIGGGSLVSVSWALQAIGLMALGVMRGSRPIRLAAIFTLLLLLIRLFTVDLASLDLAAKTAIFLGIGLMLFAAGYFLPKFLPRNDKSR